MRPNRGCTASACGRDAGVELRPYWGVPGIDHVLRERLDEHAEMVEVLRELGRRAGVEYAYVGVVLARKSG